MAKKRKARKRRSSRAGAVPGTLEIPEGASESRLHVFTYDGDAIDEHQGLAGLGVARKRSVLWVDVVGLGSMEVVREVAERFSLHPLALEDVLHTHQRVKVEDYPGHLFIVVRSVREIDGAADVEQISMFLGDGFVVTFQERVGDAFEPVRERLRKSMGRIRSQDASYLAYAILDATVDAMFPLLEVYGDQLEQLEHEVFSSPSNALAERIHTVKQELLAIRRAVLPLREALSRLMRDEHELVAPDVRIYLRDCLDHLTQMVELISGHREMAATLMEAHLSSLGHRSNEVMKVLTMVATIFIPLSFLAGLYGMNFDPAASPYNMPELSSPYGYPALLALMLLIGGGMLVFFRRKGWL